jgi:hypothetical protein
LEGKAYGPSAALISDHLWSERFASHPHVAGRTVDLDNKISAFIGDVPAGFHFLAEATVVMPLRPKMTVMYSDRSVDAVAVLERLRSGVTAAKAEDEVNMIPPELGRQFPDVNRGAGVEATPMIKKVLRGVRGTNLLLFGRPSKCCCVQSG